MVRELLQVELSEITLTADPAYQDTTVAMRSYNEATWWGNFCEVNHQWLQTV